MALLLIETPSDFDAVFWKNFFDKANYKCKVSFINIAFADVCFADEKLPSDPKDIRKTTNTTVEKRLTSKISSKCQTKKR